MALRRALFLSLFIALLAACGAPSAAPEQATEPADYAEWTPQTEPSPPPPATEPPPTAAQALPTTTAPPPASRATATLRPPQSLPTDPPASPTAAFLVLTPIGPLLNTPVPIATALPNTGGADPTATAILIPVTGGGESGGNVDPSLLVEERMEEINAQLTRGRLAYDPPESLAVGQTTVLTVGLVPLINQTAPEADATLAVDLNATPEELETVTISTSLLMEAELTGPAEAFTIRPLQTNPRQAVISGDTTQWAWEVTALRPGNHTLTLTISVVLDVGGQTETRSKTYESDIEVAVDAGITGRYLLNRYWIPLLALALVTGGSGTFLTVRQLRFREQKRTLMAALAAAPPTAGQKFIFMSYSHRDERFAIPLARGLMDKGIHIWIDQKEIIAGEDWTEQLQIGLSETDALLVVISPRSMASRWVMQEVAAAQQAGKPVFPVMYKTVDLPPNLTKIHFVDFRTDFPTALETLAGNLQQAGFGG